MSMKNQIEVELSKPPNHTLNLSEDAIVYSGCPPMLRKVVVQHCHSDTPGRRLLGNQEIFCHPKLLQADIPLFSRLSAIRFRIWIQILTRVQAQDLKILYPIDVSVTSRLPLQGQPTRA